MIYKAGEHTGVENDKFIHFNFPAGTYSIDHLNAKITVLISRQRKGWEPPQVKDLKLVNSWPQIIFLSRLAYPTIILKRIR